MCSVDHYAVLGLPSGEQGAKLSDYEINRAYRLMARVLHPDKRPDDPNAHTNFINLQKSYDLLKDTEARALFDRDLLTAQRLNVPRPCPCPRPGQHINKPGIIKASWKRTKRNKFMFGNPVNDLLRLFR